MSAKDTKDAAAAGSPKVAANNESIAYLLTAVAIVSALLVALGITGDVIGRMVRNHDELTFIAFVAALGAVALGVFARLFPTHELLQGILLVLGVVALIGATVVGLIAAVETWNDPLTPRVAASVEQTPRGQVVIVDADAASLEADERLVTTIWPIDPDGDLSEPTLLEDVQYSIRGSALYQSILGPTADGDVDVAFRVPVPVEHPEHVIVRAEVQALGEAPARDGSIAIGKVEIPTDDTDQVSDPGDCFEDGSRAGCATVNLGAPGAPQLDTSWTSAGKTPVLVLKVGGAVAAGQRPRIEVFGSNNDDTVLLGSGQIGIGADGTGREFQVAVPSTYARVCAIASTADEFPGCPPRRGAWVDRCVEDVSAGRDGSGDDLGESLNPEDVCEQYWRLFGAVTTSWLRVAVPD